MLLQESLNELIEGKSDRVTGLWAAFATRYPNWEADYAEPPVDILTFIEEPYYMNAAAECWDSVKKDLQDLLEGFDSYGFIGKYQEAVFDEGIGSGKSYKTSIILAYMLYRVLILKNPQKFLGLASGTNIYFINMSTTAQQASNIVFGEVKSRVTNSPWFNQFGYLPDPTIKSELRFPKYVKVVPGNSKETKPLGYNLFCGVMDEAAWYTETQSHDVAEDMYNALFNRIKNRFGERGLLVIISSPRYVDDFIEKKMLEGKTNDRIFCKRKPVWLAKPSSAYSGKFFQAEGFDIPLEYQSIYLRNPERFKRDYMALPSLALEPYFKNWALVEACISPALDNPIEYMTGALRSWFKGKPGMQYYGHIDLSLTSDCTGIALVHREKIENKEYIIADLLMKIKPPKDGEIDLAGIRSIILELKARGFGIAKCTFDQFQSASSIQELNKMGIASERLSVDKDLAPYETLKEAMYTGKLKMYHYPELMEELSRLELVEGKKVDHPASVGSGKDVSDALAAAVYNCTINQSDFGFGFAGGPTPIIIKKTEAEQLEDAKTLRQDGLCRYGEHFGRRY